MIFSKDLLFLHAPKTGGMSVTELLLDALPAPVFYTGPESRDRDTREGIVHLHGIRHEDLDQAEGIVAEHGFSLDSFPAILVVLRNPYALEVSRYAYLRAGHPWDFGHDQTLALTRDCPTFIRGATGSPDLSRYFFLGREVPRNLRVIRFESLTESLYPLLEELGISTDRSLPHRNRSSHRDYRTYYDGGTEEAVYRRHRWIFDLGLYDRLHPKPAAVQLPKEADLTLPLVGPIRQLARASGFWPDLWAEPVVKATMAALEDVGHVEVHAYMPAEAEGRVDLEAAVDGRVVAATSGEPGSRVRWRIPLMLSAGSTFTLEMRASSSWSPLTNGSPDHRRLAFQVIRVFCRAGEAVASR